MNIKEISDLKEKVLIDFERRVTELEKEKNKQLEAIDTVSNMLRDSQSSADKTVSTHQPVVDDEETIEPSGTVLITAHVSETTVIIDDCGDRFTKHDAEMVCANNYPHLQISRNSWHNTIKKKKSKGEIVEIREASGRRPALYEKTEKYKKKQRGFF